MTSGDLVLWRSGFRGDIICTVLGMIEQEVGPGECDRMKPVTVLKLLTATGERYTVPMNDYYDVAVLEEIR